MTQLQLSEKVFENLSRAPGNDRCADCKVPIAVSLGNGSLSTRFGVMLCESCGEVHKRVLQHTKVVALCDFHTKLLQAELNFLADRSNSAINKSLERNVSPSYRRPSATAPLIVKEEFVRAKYERGEFIEERPDTLTDFRGTLLKRGKNKDTWKVRWFVLSQRDNSLTYYTKVEQRTAKARIGLADLNVTFASEKCGRQTAMQFTYLHRGSTRSLFVAAPDENSKVTIDWYNALRHAKLQYLRIAYPTCDDESLIHGNVSASTMRGFSLALPDSNGLVDCQTASPSRATSVCAPPHEDTATLRKLSLDSSTSDQRATLTQSTVAQNTPDETVNISMRHSAVRHAFSDNLTHDFEMEGWLTKAPPRRRDAWCNRWFVLDGRKLSYYTEPLDPFAKGEIFVGPVRDGFNLIDGIPKDVVSLFDLRIVEQNSDSQRLQTSQSSASGLSATHDESGSSVSVDVLADSQSPNPSSRRLTVTGKSVSRSVDALTEEQLLDRAFTLLTPSRTFVLVAPNAALKMRWLEALTSVVYTSPQPKDNQTAATLVRKRRNDVQTIVSMLREKL